REEGLGTTNVNESSITGEQEKERIRARIEEEIRARERFRIEVVPSEVIASQANKSQETCKNLCGDGICQRFVCLAIGCPCAETDDTCPSDCSLEEEYNLTSPSAEKAEIANPASVFCKRYGYIHKIEKTKEGEAGYCIMPNGEVCDEWKFYRGECGERYRNAFKLDLSNESENVEIDPIEGMEVENKKIEVVGATPVYTARIKTITTPNMNKEAIRITCRERIRLRDCKNLSEEECERLLKERFEKECLEKLEENLGIENLSVSIDVNNETKVISVQIGNLTFRTRNRLHLRMNQLFIETPHKNISINVIPSVATQVVMTKEPMDEIKNAELEVENETIATYKIEGNRKAKLIGIIPVELKIRARVNSETGDIISVEKPWWSFLTIR
ncbi:MAG: DUF333 domain-containing protein, partial [Candidatus Aenigmatarchaeota archaeon]